MGNKHAEKYLALDKYAVKDLFFSVYLVSLAY